MTNDNKIQILPLMFGLAVLVMIFSIIYSTIPLEQIFYFYIFLGILAVLVIFTTYKCIKDYDFRLKTLSILKKIGILISKLGLEIMKKARKEENKTKKEKKAKRKYISPALRKKIFKRADNACQHCGHNFGLDVHHIDENRANNNMNNLILLCANCHRMVGGISKIALKNECEKTCKKVQIINDYRNI